MKPQEYIKNTTKLYEEAQDKRRKLDIEYRSELVRLKGISSTSPNYDKYATAILEHNYEQAKELIQRGFERHLLAEKEAYLRSQLVWLEEKTEDKSFGQVKREVESIIDDLLCDACMGTKIVPTRFVQLYETKKMISRVITEEVFKNLKETSLHCILCNYIAREGDEESIDYVSARLIRLIETQRELAVASEPFKSDETVEMTKNTQMVVMDKKDSQVYAKMLRGLMARKALNGNKVILSVATKRNSIRIANYTPKEEVRNGKTVEVRPVEPKGVYYITEGALRKTSGIALSAKEMGNAGIISRIKELEGEKTIVE